MEEYIPVIDTHTHVFPDKIAGKSREAVGKFYSLPMYTTGTEGELDKIRSRTLSYEGKTFRITKQLICSPAVTPTQTEGINRFIGKLSSENPCLIGFGTLHPENKDYREIINGIKESGLRGIKFHSDFQQFNIDDKKMYPIYRLAAEKGLPILFHMGDKKLDYSAPSRLARVIEDIPGLKIIAAHMGGYSRWNEAIRLPVSENLYFDISSSLGIISYDTFAEFLERFGYEHFFFGSDFPMWEPYEILKILLGAGLEEKVLRAIVYDNFINMLTGC